MRASIIVNNYNYGRYLGMAIDSALDQDYDNVDVVVVDDGSTDESREIIAAYGDDISVVLKQNGGQGSALNAGFAASVGDIVIFLDADDSLDMNAVRVVVEQFSDPSITKVQWLLSLIDETGRTLGGTRPSESPPDGDLRANILEQGPSSCPSSPTSGNAWSRTFLDRVMPVPVEVQYYRTCADEYLFNLAPVFGKIRTIPRSLGKYRLHAKSIYSARPFKERLALEVEGHKEQCIALARVLTRNGIEINLKSWHRQSWFGRLSRAIDRIKNVIPARERFVLADGNTWDVGEVFGSRALPVMERAGLYWGEPQGTNDVLDELERNVRRGVRYFVLAWPSFWWLEHYQGLRGALEARATCLAEDELLAVYEFSAVVPTSTDGLRRRG